MTDTARWINHILDAVKAGKADKITLSEEMKGHLRIGKRDPECIKDVAVVCKAFGLDMGAL